MKITETITWIAVEDQLPPSGHEVQAWNAKSNTWTGDAMYGGNVWHEYTQFGFEDGMGWCRMASPPTHWAEKPKGPKGD